MTSEDIKQHYLPTYQGMVGVTGSEPVASSYVHGGFAPSLGLFRSQIVCKLYRSPSDEIINRGPHGVYAGTQKRLFNSPTDQTRTCVYECQKTTAVIWMKL